MESSFIFLEEYVINIFLEHIYLHLLYGINLNYLPINSFPFCRGPIFMRAAELIATKYRYDLLAATMVGQVGISASVFH